MDFLKEQHIARGVKSLTDRELVLFEQYLEPKKKSKGVAIILCLLLGAIGMHHFYMGRYGWGFLYILISPFFLSLLGSIIDLFTMETAFQNYNLKIREQALKQVISLRDNLPTSRVTPQIAIWIFIAIIFGLFISIPQYNKNKQTLKQVKENKLSVAEIEKVFNKKYEETKCTIKTYYRYIKLKGEHNCNLEKSFLVGKNLSFANLYQAKLERANLQRVILRNADLQWANLKKANLKKADLSYANIESADFKNANLSGVNFTGAKMYLATFQNADLSRANLLNQNLNQVDMRGANLQFANLQGANFQYADLGNADLKGANLQGADLKGINLNGANLRGADLRGAEIRKMDLRGAKLQFAKMD